MSRKSGTKGSCLCGAVRLSINTANRKASACHCRMCRKWGSGAFIAFDCGASVEIEGGESVTVFDSSPWADRGFCKKCGTHLFYRLKAANHYSIPAALLDDDSRIELATQLFIDEKPPYYSFSNVTQDLTAAEAFEKYASSPK